MIRQMPHKKSFLIGSAFSKFITKNGDLNDQTISNAFHEAEELYLDGAILEARDICIDIVNAINWFERNYGGL